MKPLRIFLLSAMLILAVSALGQGTKTVAVATAPQAQASQAAPTLASAIDREISAVEKQVLDAAEARCPRFAAFREVPCRRGGLGS
jgi:hypothetical protein